MAHRVLIAEADDEFRATLGRRIAAEQFRVFEAGNPAAARNILARKNPDVVIIGLKRFGREGLSLLQYCKSRRPLTEVVVVVGRDQVPLSIEAMKLGAFDDVQMPLDMNALVDVIKKAGEKRTARKKSGPTSLAGKFRDAFAAVSFAEVGEFEAARELSAGEDAPSDSTHRSAGGDEEDVAE